MDSTSSSSAKLKYYKYRYKLAKLQYEQLLAGHPVDSSGSDSDADASAGAVAAQDATAPTSLPFDAAPAGRTDGAGSD